jgi:hypothetical protein
MQLLSNVTTSNNVSVTNIMDSDDPSFGATAQATDDTVGIELVRAGRFGASVAYRYAKGWITAEADFQPALTRPRADVHRKAVINARLGIMHRLTQALSLGTGFFTDRSASAEDFAFVDGSGDFYGVTVGLELSDEHMMAPGERAKSLYFTSVFAVRYAFSHGAFGSILGDANQIDFNPFITTRGSIDIHELGLYVGGGLRF